MKLNQSQLADLLGVSRQRMGAVKKKGRVAPGADGKYDTDDPLNRTYIREHFARELADAASEDDEDAENLTREKTEADIRYKRVAADRYELQNAKSRNELIPREMVVAMAGAFGSGVRTYLLGLPARIVGTIVAKVKSGNDDDVQPYLEGELSDSLERALSMGETSVDAVLDGWNESDDDEDETAE